MVPVCLWLLHLISTVKRSLSLTTTFLLKVAVPPILGVEQDFAARQEDPTVNGSLDERREQAQAVNDFVDGVLANDANSNIVVVGDFNEFEFVSPLQIVEGTTVSTNGGQGTAPGGTPVLTNLIDDIPADERYSFIFQGNSQQLDHILVSDSLTGSTEIDIVHVNTEFAESDQRASDHDPVVTRLTFEQVPGEEIIGTRRRDTLVGTEGNDIIRGLGARDIITGAGGDDTIIGGRGHDLLTGGVGSDTFVYESLLDRSDHIIDFDVNADLIDFSDIFEDLRRYGSATPFDDYVRVVQGARGANVQIDLNGDFGRRDRFRTFALLEGVAASDVTVDNFVV